MPTLIPPVIRLMNHTAPDVNLSTVEGHFLSMLPALNDSRLDFIIARAWQPQEYPGSVQRKLYDERLLVVAGAAPSAGTQRRGALGQCHRLSLDHAA
ncbi:MAG: hypothetical protein JJU19_03815 [Pararhodobacter sp.]|nr:hypothetical protein [Pararhodobacter sp.]